jgi:hypothetical protein
MRNSVLETFAHAIRSASMRMRRAIGAIANRGLLPLAFWIGAGALAGTCVVGCAGSSAVNYPVEVQISGNAPGSALKFSIYVNSESDFFLYGNGGTLPNFYLTNGESYEAGILGSPEGENCEISGDGGMGTVNNAPVLITVSCSLSSYSISGTVTGLLPGNQLVIQDNGADNYTVSADGQFTFPTPIQSGSSYAVTVLSQTAAMPQNCTVTNGSGGVGPSAAIQGNLVISCGEIDHLARTQGDSLMKARSLNHLGEALRKRGNFAAAAASYEDALVAARAVGSPGTIAMIACNFGRLLVAEGAVKHARDLLREALVISLENHVLGLIQSMFEAGAGLAFLSGKPRLAARLHGAALDRMRESGARREPVDEEFIAPLMQRARETLGSAAFDSEETIGRGMGIDAGLLELDSWMKQGG